MQKISILDPIAHRYVTSVGVWPSKKIGKAMRRVGGGGGGGCSYTCISSSGSSHLNWPQLPAHRPCAQDRQHDDASWFNSS